MHSTRYHQTLFELIENAPHFMKKTDGLSRMVEIELDNPTQPTEDLPASSDMSGRDPEIVDILGNGLVTKRVRFSFYYLILIMK